MFSFIEDTVIVNVNADTSNSTSGSNSQSKIFIYFENIEVLSVNRTRVNSSVLSLVDHLAKKDTVADSIEQLATFRVNR